MSHASQPEAYHPVYWFVILQRAVEDHNFTAAAEAQRELEKLGVRVQYGRHRWRKEASQ